MKRFLKIFVLLIVGLLALVSGVDATLDHMNRAASQSSFTAYNEKGQIVLAYKGDLANCTAYAKPGPVAPSHRGALPESEYRWF